MDRKIGDEGTGKRGFKPNVDFSQQRPGAKALIVNGNGIFKYDNGKLETLADAVDYFWGAVSQNPAEWQLTTKGYDYLIAHAGTATREDLRRALNWLELCIQRRERGGAVAAARYLSLMPVELLAEDALRLQTVFNSRILGMVWQVTPDLDVKPLPPRIPKFGQEAGYGLIRSVPELYEKLAMLTPELEDIVLLLVREALRYRVSLPPALVAMAEPPAATG